MYLLFYFDIKKQKNNKKNKIWKRKLEKNEKKRRRNGERRVEFLVLRFDKEYRWRRERGVREQVGLEFGTQWVEAS